jgi:uncharacterized DUF497 family protein
MEFDWDPAKAEKNRRKHAVTFEEALTVFHPAEPEIFEDEAHSDEEELRFIAIGFSEKSRLLMVSFVRHRATIRIISARRANEREAKFYAQAKSSES